MIRQGGKRKADPQGLALILTGRRCTLAAMRERGVGVMRVAVLFRAGGAAASAHASQAERAAEAMRRHGWRGEARRAIRVGAWPERRSEGLKPEGTGRRRRPGAKPESPTAQPARKSQSLQDGGIDLLENTDQPDNLSALPYATRIEVFSLASLE